MKTYPLLILLISVFLQGCTVCRYTLENKLCSKDLSTKNIEIDNKVRHIDFSIRVDGEKYFRTMVSKFSHKQLTKMKERYSKATIEVLSSKGYNSGEVTAFQDPNLSINILEVPHIGATADEYLTGLSFGLIPSWPTRKKQYIYDFREMKSKHSHKYWVNDKRFNHLIAFPVFWTIFFIDKPIDKYKEALCNFLEFNNIQP